MLAGCCYIGAYREYANANKSIILNRSIGPDRVKSQTAKTMIYKLPRPCVNSSTATLTPYSHTYCTKCMEYCMYIVQLRRSPPNSRVRRCYNTMAWRSTNRPKQLPSLPFRTFLATMIDHDRPWRSLQCRQDQP